MTNPAKEVHMRGSLSLALIGLFLFSQYLCLDAAFAEVAVSDPIRFGEGTVHVLVPRPLESTSPDVLIHFHGSAEVAQENFRRAGIPGVLLTVNFNGLSSAYSRPFRESEDLFERLLAVGLAEIPRLTKQTTSIEWGEISLSSFSAGYGAVREILKNPRHLERVSAILAADSIYASLQEGSEARIVNSQQMRDFRRFARLAVQNRKSFIITHSYLETPYASTLETADDILSFVGVERVQPTDRGDEPLVLRNVATKGRLKVFGYEGTDGEAHMQHLRQIGRWWKVLK
jgi:hypothetical protein